MKISLKKIISIFFVLSLFFSSCKTDFLDAKPSTSITQPLTLEEFQKLLDNYSVVNQGSGLGILASDEYEYSSDAIWQSTPSATERNSYIWAKDLYEGEKSEHWNSSYSSIFYANNVLAGLQKINPNQNRSEWNRIKGAALFLRAFGYYDLVKNFSNTYDQNTASIDLGVPLRLTPSIDDLIPRATLADTYNQILNDLSQAAQLMDPAMPVARSRPSKASAYALLARVNLNMRNYINAELYADTCLSIYSKIIDYNTLSKTSAGAFAYNHDEQIFAKIAVSSAAYITTGTASGANTFIQVPASIVSLYDSNDLRTQIYFVKQTNGTYDFKRGYTGAGLSPFIGLATDEVYLIKAECAARRNDLTASMSSLNTLLVKRYLTNTFVPITASTGPEALSKVLLERRKELIWRGLRWDDLKRLNKEGENITLTRIVNGQTYSLAPNDPRYVFPIPDNEISLSGIQQNLR